MRHLNKKLSAQIWEVLRFCGQRSAPGILVSTTTVPWKYSTALPKGMGRLTIRWDGNAIATFKVKDQAIEVFCPGGQVKDWTPTQDLVVCGIGTFLGGRKSLVSQVDENGTPVKLSIDRGLLEINRFALDFWKGYVMYASNLTKGVASLRAKTAGDEDVDLDSEPDQETSAL